LKFHFGNFLQVRSKLGILERSGDEHWYDDFSLFISQSGVHEPADRGSSYGITVFLREDGSNAKVELLLTEIDSSCGSKAARVHGRFQIVRPCYTVCNIEIAS